MALAFEEFELDEELYELRLRGERVAIRPQALDVLFHLVRHRDRVVTKEELLGEVWSGAAVSETAIPQAILAVRRALGDDGDSPRLVQTIRARGYRFLGTIGEPTSATDLPFVGRQALLRRAREIVTAAAGGAGGALAISGGVGSGKTRALLEIAAIARDAGFAVVTARGHDEEGVPELWPWRSALRALDLSIDETDARFTTFDLVVRALGERAKKTPLVVMIDDLQWADAGSLLLLKLVAQSFRATPAIVVFAYRDGVPNPVMARTVGAISREDPTRCLTLDALDAAAIAILASAVLGREGDPPTIERLRTKTGGCPLFVIQMLHALRTQTGDRSTSAMLALDAMREAIGHHLGELSEDCRTVLAAATVFAGPFTIAPLASTLERRPDEVLAALDEALAHKILARGPTYRFIHQLVRDVLYKKLSFRERFTLHQRAAGALRSAGDEPGAIDQDAKAAALVV